MVVARCQERTARMHDAPGPLREAHIERPSRRRDLTAIGLSLVIHGLTAVLVAFFWVQSVGGSPAETDTIADVIVEEQARTAAPPPPPVPTQAPLPTQAPRPRPIVRPIPRRRTVP